jgi:hypothetical protein
MSDLSPLSGVKRKLDFGAVRTGFDPKRTSRLKESQPARETFAAIANTFHANLTSSDGNPEAAIEAAAAQHGVDTATVREIIAQAGGLESEVGDIVEHSTKLGCI